MQVTKQELDQLADAIAERMKKQCVEEVVKMKLELQNEQERRMAAERLARDVGSHDLLRSAGFRDVWASDRFTRMLRDAWFQFDLACTVIAVGTQQDAIALGYSKTTTSPPWPQWLCVQALRGELLLPAGFRTRAEELRAKAQWEIMKDDPRQ